jgi:DNA polymerase III epsilon subunit-like protein
MNNKKYLILDTETTNDIETPICYDIGFAVIGANGTVYEKHSYVVAEVFLDSDLMASAYFSDKIPTYQTEIDHGIRKLRRWKTIKHIVKDVMAQWNISEVIAHNVRFDYLSTHTTQRYLTSSKYRWFFPYGTRYIDTLKMAREVFGKDKKYLDFCKSNNYLCANGTPRFTAEIVYRFIAKDNNFIESHTALEDVLIEKEIFAECIKRNPEINGELWA